LDKNGKKKMVEVTKDGKHFFRDTNGNINMVNKDD